MYSCGLVLEGGGNRAVYTSGVLDAFMENNIEFPYIIGVSAGSCNGVSFMGKSYKRQHDIVINYVNDKRYMSFDSMLKCGEFLNCDWIFGELSYDLMPLDQETYDKSNTVLCVVVTNAKTGKAEYMYPKSMRQRGCKYLRASCSLPGATKGVKLGEDYYYDGGIADSIPLKRAYDDGCQKAVVILTQDEHYVKRSIGHERIIKKIFKQYPMLSKGLLERHAMYNDELQYVKEQENINNAFVIRPSEPLNCSTLEKSVEKLEQIYQQGYMDALKRINDLKEYMDK